MKNLFSFDSPFMQALNFIGELILINLLFIFCSLPIVTLGASLTGLSNAMRILEDPENDSSCTKAFFRGFRDGFAKITVLWLVFLLLDGILIYTILMSLSYADTGLFVHWLFPCVMLVISLTIQTLTVYFHSRFDCKGLQLVRNGLLLLITHPLRSLYLVLVTWLPLGLFLAAPGTFVTLTPVFLTVYFSFTYLLGAMALKKPFKMLVDHIENEED